MGVSCSPSLGRSPSSFSSLNGLSSALSSRRITSSFFGPRCKDLVAWFPKELVELESSAEYLTSSTSSSWTSSVSALGFHSSSPSPPSLPPQPRPLQHCQSGSWCSYSSNPFRCKTFLWNWINSQHWRLTVLVWCWLLTGVPSTLETPPAFPQVKIWSAKSLYCYISYTT